MDRTRLSRFINQQLQELPLEQPAVVAPSASVRSALAEMQRDSRSCVLIMDAGKLVGIFTEWDVLTRCMQDGFDWDQAIGESVATRAPTTIAGYRSVAEAIATFQQHSYRTLPVMNEGRVAGLIRVGDVLRHLAEAFPEEVLNLPPRPHQVMEKPEGG
jgi:CBS domain-containing protein